MGPAETTTPRIASLRLVEKIENMMKILSAQKEHSTAREAIIAREITPVLNRIRYYVRDNMEEDEVADESAEERLEPVMDEISMAFENMLNGDNCTTWTFLQLPATLLSRRIRLQTQHLHARRL